MLGHQAGALAEHSPCEQCADDGVSDAAPDGGNAVAPTELSGVADEDDGGEVSGAEAECCHPRTDFIAAEDEVIDTFGFARGDHADGDHQDGIKHDDHQCDDLRSCHERKPPII